MLRRLIPALCERRVSAVLKQQTRNSTCFCFNTCLPAIPRCYWSTLPNGFRVITEQITGPLACVALFAEAGSRFENSCNNGACHFFEHMAYHGLFTLRRYLFEEFFREIGAHLTVHTDREYQAFICTCPHATVPAVINLFSRIFCELECNPVEFMSAKNDVYTQLSETEMDLKQLCFDYLHQAAFQGTALARSPIGPWKNYLMFDPPFLAAFVAQHYQPFRLVLSVASAFCHHDIVCKAQYDFGYMQRTTNELVHWPCRYSGSMLRYRDDSFPFCHIAIAVEVGGYSSPDFITLHLLKHIVGRWDVSQSQGYNTWPLVAQASAVDKLCHRYESFYIPYQDVGLWGVYFVIDKEDDYEDAFITIQDQWMKLCTSVALTDIERGASALKLELAKAADGAVASCMDMGLQMLYWGHRKNLLELYEMLDMKKLLEVKELASRVIYDRCPVVAALGPTEAMPDYTRLRANMYWLRF